MLVMVLVVGGWWLVVGGWWVVGGGWWVVGGWWAIAITQAGRQTCRQTDKRDVQTGKQPYIHASIVCGFCIMRGSFVYVCKVIAVFDRLGMQGYSGVRPLG